MWMMLRLAVIMACSALGVANGGSILTGEATVDVVERDERHFQLPVPVTDSWKRPTAEIFVTISHYRDVRCPLTLKNLFTKAKYPKRIMVGLVKQVHTEEDNLDCLRAYCQLMGAGTGPNCPYRDQISHIELAFLNSRGPSLARHLEIFLVKDEDFCMTTDSHTDFASDWDVSATQMWGSIGNEYAVLSTLPDDESRLSSANVPHLCEATFTNNGVVRNLEPVRAKDLARPLLAPLWSGAFSFSRCHAELKTPPDPKIEYVIDGYEFSKFARLWTRGYDVYTPTKNFVSHDRDGKMLSKAPKMGNSHEIDQLSWMKQGMTDEWRRDAFDSSVLRLKTLLGSSGGEKTPLEVATLTQYGLGNKRSLDQLIEFTGIDTRGGAVVGDRCKQLAWVPFAADADPNVVEGDVWGMAPEKLRKGDGSVPLMSGEIEIYKHAESAGPASVSGSGAADHFLRRGTEQTKPASMPPAGELWWMLQFVDAGVEAIIWHVDERLGGRGLLAVQLILLSAPVFFAVVFFACYMVFGSRAEGIKRI